MQWDGYSTAVHQLCALLAGSLDGSSGEEAVRLCALSAGLLSEDADSRGMVTGHLWLSWDTNGGARMVMGPQPDRAQPQSSFPLARRWQACTMTSA